MSVASKFIEEFLLRCLRKSVKCRLFLGKSTLSSHSPKSVLFKVCFSVFSAESTLFKSTLFKQPAMGAGTSANNGQQLAYGPGGLNPLAVARYDRPPIRTLSLHSRHLGTTSLDRIRARKLRRRARLCRIAMATPCIISHRSDSLPFSGPTCCIPLAELGVGTDLRCRLSSDDPP